jgi:glucose/arabinose dehydrogenase
VNALLAAVVVLTPLVTGLDRPVQVVAAGDRLYVAEQPGRILRLGNGGEVLLDIRGLVGCCDNGGLLSFTFDPANHARLYVLYVDRNGDTVLARYVAGFGEVLLTIPQPKDNLPNHHGGTLQFGPDGYLYVSIGDGGASVRVTNRAQELDQLLGKLLRIDVRTASGYTIPSDNPFAGVPGARGEIWAYGLRNPWRFSFDRLTGDLLLGDVGQNDWEEVNILSLHASRAANFGWPKTEGQHCYPPRSVCSADGLALPAIAFPRELGCSVTGGHRYRGSRWPGLYGTYVYGDWCSGRIWVAYESGGQWYSRIVLDTDMAIVSFAEDAAGELYVVDYAGAVYELGAPAPRRRSIRH